MLKLRRLPLAEIDRNVFQGLNALQDLWITSCGLREPPPLNHIRSTIKLLNLYQNDIQYIPNRYFEGCTELDVLNVNHDKMTSIPNISTAARTIKYIYMSYNNIISLESLKYTYFPSLHSLYLSHNYISSISWSFLKNMPHLYIITLKYNRLVQIPDIRVMLYDRYKQPLLILLEDDHWSCDANILWIWDGVDHEDYFGYDINNTTLQLIDVFRMKCHSPNHTRGLSFWDISKYKTHIHVSKTNYTLILLICIFFIRYGLSVLT